MTEVIETVERLEALLALRNETPRIPNLARAIMSDALTLIKQLVERDQWQPIETAPKDGTTILACGPYYAEPQTVAWRGKCWKAAWDGGSVIESQGDFGTTYVEADPLTHWRNLPAPPVSP